MIAANDDPAVPGAPRRLYVLGAVRVAVDDSAIALTGDAARLIAYLAIDRSRHQREVLSDRLWPGAGAAARRRLNDTLYRLGRTIGDGWLVKNSATVGLADAVWVDATVFGILCASQDREDIERGIDVYGGELAPGIYDEWVHEPREWHRNLLSRALGEVIAWCEADGEFESALLHARRLVSIDSFDEGAHRAYLRALGRLHRYGEAAAHYDAFVELLARELGVSPDAETTALVAQLAREREVAVDGAPDQTRLVGRAPERRSAIEAVEAMFAGRGSVWCVQGPAGIGKSRLIDELVQSAGWRGATVLRGEVELTPEVSPLAPLAHALAPVLTAPVRAQVESRLDVASRRALAPVHPGWAGPSGSDSPDSPARSHAAFRVVGATLAGIEPTVLVIDDLHWADATLWLALDGFADGFVLGGGLVVGGFRYPEIEHGPGWERLQEWDRRGHATMCTLEPLMLDEVAELVGDLASPETVHAVTGGVPFYVEQWRRAPTGDRAGPEPIIESRLDALGPEARQALEGAAVLGGRVDFRAWTEVSGIASLELASISDHLVKDGWLTPTLDGCVFTHDILQTAVYDRIDPAERIGLHRRAAAAVARSQPNNTRTLAFHLDEAGARSAAAAAYRATAESQRAESAFDAAAHAWSRALELLPASPPRDRLDVALDLAEVCDVISDLTRQQPVLQEAIALARQLDDPGALLRLLKLAGGAAVRSGDIDVAETILDEAAQLADSLGDAPSQADILFRRGDLLIQTGRWARGDTHFAEGLRRLVPAENPWLYGRLLRGRAICAVRTGRAAEAADLLERALATFSDADDRLNEMVTLTSLFSAYYEQGAWDLLESAIDRAGPIARDLGDAVNIGLVHQARGLAALALGDRTAARNLMIECQRCFEAAGRPRLVSSAINVRGLIAADNDEIDDAEALYTEAIAKASSVKATTEVAYVRHDLGALLLRTRRANEAIEELRFAADHWAETGHPMLHAKSAACLGIAILDAGGPREEPTQIADAGLELLRSGAVTGEHPQAWLWHLAELLQRLDRHDHRADVVVAAHDELVRQAHAIEDPVRRRQFFELVPLNRSIAAAHAELDHRTTTASTTARLARADAPLGRVLRADELVEVNLTVHTAADEAFDEPARRRHRLRRLLTEADTQGAAPTDDQLAELLLVSRRTILRDMAELEREGVVTATRRRRRRPASPNRGAGSSHS